MKKKYLYFLILFILLGLGACTKSEQEPKLTLRSTEVEATKGQQFMSVVTEETWTISITSADNDSFLTANPSEGTGNKTVTLSWDANPNDSPRACTITLETPNYKVKVALTQAKKSADGGEGQGGEGQGGEGQGGEGQGGEGQGGEGQGGEGQGGEGQGGGELASKAGWLELPATDNPDLVFITHDMTRGNKKMRNWSCYYDKDAKLSHWVAYPLNKSLIGSGSRSNDWGYDPKIDRNYQPNLHKGYGGGYDRGHQLPSADRLERASNVTTFYYTNMTPQRGVLNQKAWGTLEGMVREWSYNLDTLYVVTGADIKGSTQYATDNDGVRCKVPTGYYKALLGYKKGGSIGNKTAGYIGIAFYFDHKEYSNSAIMSQSMSIDALESKLGIDFFVNLPTVTNEEIANAVESKVDSWW